MNSIDQFQEASQQSSAVEQREAYELIRAMLEVEKPLAEYEAYANAQQETRQRIADLLVLDAWYKRNIGVAFQYRHAYRWQLLNIIDEKTRSISQTKMTALTEFERISESPRIIAIQNSLSD